MKPSRILLFFLSVFAVLLLLSLVFPKDGIQIGEEMDLQFMDASNLFKKDSVQVNVITAGLINLNSVSDDPEYGGIDSVLILRDTIPDINTDSIIKAKVDSISSAIHPIEFSSNGKVLLQRFFSAAEDANTGSRPLRILHYGDSQLENDRMTSLLRFRVQKVFGGSGCGMVPAVPLYFGNPTFIEAIEGDWIRYTGFGKRDSSLGHRSYGAMNCFTALPADSSDKEAFLRFEFRKGRRASRFSSMKLFLHAYANDGSIVISVNDTISDTLTNVYEGFQVIDYRPEVSVENIQLNFEIKEGGRIYGISFDSNAGIQMDNMAMRGSSGLEFRRQDSLYLKNMLDFLNPGLFILQFGGNTVPYIKKTGFYKSSFKKELLYLRSLCPDAAIIVIGPSDMSRKEKGKFITWESVEPVRNALKGAALDAGCAFWDMYEAMGGENSMDAFVKSTPALAQADYTHFTPKGANLIAEMFLNSLMVEYSRYQSTNNDPDQ